MIQGDLTHGIEETGYSGHPFAFLDAAPHRALSDIIAMDLIENGDAQARRNWQDCQLDNLLSHARTRSGFWRDRLPTGISGLDSLAVLPIQSRRDIAEQTKQEGSLLVTSTGTPARSYPSTGSTGTPVEVFVTPFNGYYNSTRSIAQYLMNGMPLDENRVQIGPPSSVEKLHSRSLRVTRHERWAGAMSRIFRNGKGKVITHNYDNEALIGELSSERVGYLNCPSRIAAVIVEAGGPELIRRLGIRAWIHMSDYREPELVRAFDEAGARTLSTYSAGETGPIALECTKCPGHFHVAHTNVVVEGDESQTADYDGITLQRLLITHLHSYATPIIRYDIGDFGTVERGCPCGHNGQTLRNIYGRGKQFLRLPDGGYLAFYLSTRLLREVVDFEDCKIRQTDLNTIEVELGGRSSIGDEEVRRLTDVIIRSTAPAFTVVVKPTPTIDWSGNTKRLFFSSLVK